MPYPCLLSMAALSKSGTSLRELPVRDLVIAGWTGRDQAALEAHIRELEAVGVARPASTPIFYRVGAALLTTDSEIEVSGACSSGEVEFVLISAEDGLWVGVGSDHTDRKAEVVGVALSKQMCPKPIAPTMWRFDEVAPHWDRLILRSHVGEGAERRLYQEGPVSAMRAPSDLIARYSRDGVLPPGTTMFCGTLAAHGGISYAPTFEIELEDPMLGRKITHRYRVHALPVAG